MKHIQIILILLLMWSFLTPTFGQSATPDLKLESWKTIQKHLGTADSISCEASNLWIAVLTRDNNIQLYFQDTGDYWKTLDVPKGSELHFTCLSFSNDGKYLVTGTKEGYILVWSLPELNLFKTLEQHTKAINTICFHPNGKIFATAGADTQILLWNIPEFTLFRRLEEHYDEVTYLHFTNNGKILLSIANDNMLKLWQIKENDIFVRPTTTETEKSTASLYQEALAYKIKGNFKKSSELCKEILQYNNKYADALYLMATLYGLQCNDNNGQMDSLERERLIALAVENLNKAFEAGFQDWIKFEHDPAFMSIKNDTRFLNLIAKFEKTLKPKTEEVVYHQPKELEEQEVKKESIKNFSLPISFTIHEEGGKLDAQAYEIIVNGQKISPEDKFFPGYNYDVIIKFKEYATVIKNVFLKNTGKDHFVLTAKLDKLKEYKFSTRDKSITLDGLVYPYKFLADDVEIESHLIEYYKKGVFYYYTIQVPLDARRFRLLAGYLYEDRYFGELKDGITRIEHLSIPLLMDHLDKLAIQGNAGYKVPIIALEKLLKSRYWSSRIQAAPIQEISELINHIEAWDVTKEADLERIRLIVNAIESLIGYSRTRDF